MNKTADQVQKELAKPFELSGIEWRVQRSGVKNGKPWAMVLCYLTSRAIQNRLDEVFGVFGWENSFKDLPNGGVECTIRVKNHETGEWVSKSDAAPATDIEAVKGGRSSAMKRAAVHLGIGRYLYDVPASFADCFTDKRGSERATFKDPNQSKPINGSFQPPQLPSWALPSPEVYQGETRQEAPASKPPPVSTANPQQMKLMTSFLSQNGLDTGEKLPNVLAFVSKQIGRSIDGVSKIPENRFDDVFTRLKEKVSNDEQPKLYPADQFEVNFPIWEKLISSGKKSAAHIIAQVTSKGRLSEDQINKINAVTKTGATA